MEFRSALHNGNPFSGFTEIGQNEFFSAAALAASMPSLVGYGVEADKPQDIEGY